MTDEPRAAGQVWRPKAWPNSLFLLLFLDETNDDEYAEVWAALDLETAELRDVTFNLDSPTRNVRVT